MVRLVPRWPRDSLRPHGPLRYTERSRLAGTDVGVECSTPWPILFQLRNDTERGGAEIRAGTHSPTLYVHRGVYLKATATSRWNQYRSVRRSPRTLVHREWSAYRIRCFLCRYTSSEVSIHEDVVNDSFDSGHHRRRTLACLPSRSTASDAAEAPPRSAPAPRHDRARSGSTPPLATARLTC